MHMAVAGPSSDCHIDMIINTREYCQQLMRRAVELEKKSNQLLETEISRQVYAYNTPCAQLQLISTHDYL